METILFDSPPHPSLYRSHSLSLSFCQLFSLLRWLQRFPIFFFTWFLRCFEVNLDDLVLKGRYWLSTHLLKTCLYSITSLEFFLAQLKLILRIRAINYVLQNPKNN